MSGALGVELSVDREIVPNSEEHMYQVKDCPRHPVVSRHPVVISQQRDGVAIIFQKSDSGVQAGVLVGTCVEAG